MKKIFRGMQNAAEDIQENFDELNEKITKKGKVFFSGSSYFVNTQAYPIDMNEIKESLVLIFDRFDPATNKVLEQDYQTVVIPKADIPKRTGKMRSVIMPGGEMTFKRFFVSPTEVRGHNSNSDSPKNIWVLVEVYAN